MTNKYRNSHLTWEIYIIFLMAALQYGAENHFLIDMGFLCQQLDLEIGGLSELNILPQVDKSHELAE